MGFWDEAQDALDRGVASARGAVAGIAVEQQGWLKSFVSLCSDGASAGWHEANGGNLSYRLSEKEVSSCRAYFYTTPSSWVMLENPVASLAGMHFAITATGSHFRCLSRNVVCEVGIIELSAAGDAWRIVWGFKDDHRPTSELASHLLAHAALVSRHADAPRVLYHAHPTYAVALSKVLQPDSRQVTRALWQTTLEAMVAFPQGIGVVPWTVAGTSELAKATASAIEGHDLCLWVHHGVLGAAATCDDAFGLVSAVEKAAQIYLTARSAQGIAGEVRDISSDDLARIAAQYNLKVNQAYL